jgi:hypothetical protein
MKMHSQRAAHVKGQMTKDNRPIIATRAAALPKAAAPAPAARPSLARASTSVQETSSFGL